MSRDSLHDAVSAFFVGFDSAFASFDGAVVAAQYQCPYLAIRSDGSTEAFASQADIAAYFQGLLDHYHARGCRSCRHKDLEVVPLGTAAALGTVTWELCNLDGAVVSTWRESYHLVRVGERMKAAASVDHD